MKLTKDEARILSVLTDHYSVDLLHDCPFDDNKRKEAHDAVDELNRRLKDFSADQRRYGRTSMNDFWDCLKRIIFKHKLKTDARLVFSQAAASKKYRLHYLAKKAGFKVDAHKRTVFVNSETALTPEVEKLRDLYQYNIQTEIV